MGASQIFKPWPYAVDWAYVNFLLFEFVNNLFAAPAVSEKFEDELGCYACFFNYGLSPANFGVDFYGHSFSSMP